MARPRKSIWKKLEQPETRVRLSVACGFKLANDGVDTRAMQPISGHRSIQHTVRYTERAPTRFKGFWNVYWVLGGGIEVIVTPIAER